MAFLEVDESSKKVTGLSVLPIYTVNRNPWIDHQTKVLTGVQAERVLKRLSSLSHDYGGFLKIRKHPLRAVARMQPGTAGGFSSSGFRP
jgi:hypothetical protein